MPAIDQSNPTASAAANAPSASQYASHVRLDLNAGWNQKAITDQMKSWGVTLFAINQNYDVGVFLYSYPRETIRDVAGYAQTRRATQMGLMTDVTQSDIIETTISGRKAYRFEVSGVTKLGNRLTYQQTLIDGDNEVAVVMAWTSVTNFPAQKDKIEHLAETVSGL